ncbi:MAG TPA: SPW repeat protein [Usitatibacter sp.]|nr:SPW repeat protein [Usitatibacter sp.]
MLRGFKSSSWIGIVLGAWLLASPWVLGYDDHEAATINALVMGGILILEELLEGHGRESLDYWIDHVTGLWLLVSPIVLGYPALLPASLSMLFAGVITLALREQEHAWDEGHVPHRH